MKTKYKFSVIVPVYNSEKYLDECLSSIVSQKFKDYEVIVVDDGSTDGSIDIYKKYQKKYHNIVIKKQRNGGVSSARNLGIKESKGEYIIFVDSDDIISPNMMSTINNNVNNYDLIVFGYMKKFVNHSNNYNQKNDFELIEKKEKIFTDENISGYLWNKVFKKSIITDNSLFFDEKIHYSEDLLFVSNYIKFVDNIYFEDSILYQYRMRKSGVTYNFYNKKNLSIFGSLDCLIKSNNNRVIINQLVYEYIKNFYRLKRIIKKYDYKNINYNYLKQEKKVISKVNKKNRMTFYLIKYCFKLYVVLQRLKYKKYILFD